MTTNLKTDQQVLIIFSMNISDTTGHQMAIQISTSPNLCFYYLTITEQVWCFCIV